jgi:hypothetical protein
MSETLWAQTPQGRKPAGQLKKEAGRTMLVKNVSKSRHQHRTLNAWGIDATLIDQLPADVDGITVNEKEEGKTYRVSLSAFLSKSIRRDFGYGPQYFLPLPQWQQEDPRQPALFNL